LFYREINQGKNMKTIEAFILGFLLAGSVQTTLVLLGVGASVVWGLR
jgi:hypothetical protein